MNVMTTGSALSVRCPYSIDTLDHVRLHGRVHDRLPSTMRQQVDGISESHATLTAHLSSDPGMGASAGLMYSPSFPAVRSIDINNIVQDDVPLQTLSSV